MKLFRSIHAKTLAIYLIFSAFLIIFTFILLKNFVEPFFLNQFKKNLLLTTKEVKELYLNTVIKHHDIEPDQFAKKYGNFLGIRITIIDHNGSVLGDSHYNPALMENHANRPEIRKAFIKGKGFSQRYSETLKNYLFYCALKISNATHHPFFIRVSIPLETVTKNITQFYKYVLFVALCLLTLFLLFSYITHKTIMKPLETILEALKAINQGNLEVKLVPSGKNNELDFLMEQINNLVTNLENCRTNLNKIKKEFSLIIEGVDTGIIMLDKNGTVLLVNSYFIEKIDENVKEGGLYWETEKNPELIYTIKNILDGGDKTVKELSIENKTYLIKSRTLDNENKVIITFNDITLLKLSEKVKKDFVTNVSHEFRTPLTAMLGYVELLIEEEQNPERLEYLKVIHRNINRLITMVKKLVELNKLEGDWKPEYSEVDLEKLGHRIAEIFYPQFAKKNVIFNISIAKNIGTIQADEFHLESLLINLIDNALKYTEKGAVSLKIDKVEPDSIRIEVTDTGIGIPPEHQGRIFERFYMVDKSRSRTVGGSGLGLSLVKHIVNLYEGTIHVTSTPGKGTSFVITLPKHRA